jgi:hypothetical protein
MSQMERQPVDKSELRELLRQAWCQGTAMGSRWSSDCPALDQCAVTALVVQDLFGGELLRCWTCEGDSHYWNRLPDGSELDLTEEQFECISDYPLKATAAVRSRQNVLSYPNTMWRYGLLLTLLATFIRAKGY